ncbi:23S rRNA methyltransferase [Shewanella sp. NFH-SH190041]|nr:23S rRNA methyltransferase [Shewanella sp. NFH-SH190041]
MTATDTSTHITAQKSAHTTEILPPKTVTEHSIHWHMTTQVLVAGWGAAGACTALEAKSHGLDVIVADRFMGGGASAKSGGVVYAGGGTAQQADAGVNDSPEAMYEYLRHETCGVISDDTLWDFCRSSRENLRWLESLGVPFAATMPPGGKTSYPADGYYLYYSGNELVPRFAGQHNPAPRGHRTKGRGHGGKVLYHHLQSACLERGVVPMTQSRIRRLLRNPTGRVIGAEIWHLPPGSAAAKKHQRLARWAEKWQNFSPALCDRLRHQLAALELRYSEPVNVRATVGVVLSTGGYIFNRQLVKELAPGYRRNFKIGATGCDGSGLRLGQSVGAQAAHLNRVSAWRFINPPLCWPNGIAVNADGARFCNEEVYGATLGHAICEEQGGKAWLILDAALRRKAIRQALLGGYWWFQSLPALALMTLGAKKADTLTQLAAKTGMNSQQLGDSIRQYNQAIAAETDEPMGKSRACCTPLTAGPYYALDISVSSPVFPLGALTLGGLKVDESSGAVLDEGGGAIAGLYAAGRSAVGIPSNLYISGLSLADCVYSGRRAGRALASAHNHTDEVASTPQTASEQTLSSTEAFSDEAFSDEALVSQLAVTASDNAATTNAKVNQPFAPASHANHVRANQAQANQAQDKTASKQLQTDGETL